MTPADWTDRERAAIELGWRFWELGGKPGTRRNVVRSAAMKCGDFMGDPEAWHASRWPQQIGRYYANREADRNGRPRAQTKTPEQIALLEYAFGQTSGYPYTGEVLPLAFLSGLQVKQIKSWFEYQRKKCEDDGNYLALEIPEWWGMRGQETKDAAAMVRAYNRDPKEYARSLVMWERCVRTGRLGPFEELQCPRPFFKKYWNRMFPEDGVERSLLEVTEELEDSDGDSLANLTMEERRDVMRQAVVEHHQYEMNQQELEEEAEAEGQLDAESEARVRATELLLYGP